MEHLIPLDALLAEIEKLKAEALQKKSQCKRSGLEKIMHQIGAYNKVLSFIDTLEVKEVDINEEAKRKWDGFSLCYDESRGCDVVVLPYWVYKQVCKYFFELGLKAQKGE